MGRGGGRGGNLRGGARIYGMWKKSGWEAGFPTWQEQGETGKFFCNINILSVTEMAQRGGPIRKRQEAGVKGRRSGKF